jgi:hypothetical protein
MTAPSLLHIVLPVLALYREADFTTPVAKKLVYVSSAAPELRQHALCRASHPIVSVKRQLVDGGPRVITARDQVGWKNLMLRHARKWHRAALRAKILSSAGR